MTDLILVSGGAGFIGSAFIRAVASEHTVLNVDRLTYAADLERLEGLPIKTVYVDVATEAAYEVIRAARPRWLIHFAAETHVTRSESDPGLFRRTNVEGTRNVLRAAEAAGVELVIHVSTDEVYGPCEGRPFREQDKEPGEGRATSPYAKSKALADDLALSFVDRIPTVIVRPTNCFGAWQHPEKAVPRWITRALSGNPLPVWGDGLQVRDWMFVDDAVAAIKLVLERGAPGTVYNIAPESSQVTNYEIARQIAGMVGGGAEVYLTDYDRPQHDRRYAIDASTLRELGWEATVPFSRALSSTVDWYREHRSWWEPLLAGAEALYDDALQREGS